jgi:hypothetical protein
MTATTMQYAAKRLRADIGCGVAVVHGEQPVDGQPGDKRQEADGRAGYRFRSDASRRSRSMPER